MRQEVKDYLLSVKDRALGMAFGKERYQMEIDQGYDRGAGLYDGALGVFFQAMFPLTTEVVNAGVNYMWPPEISAGRAITYACLGISAAFVTAGIDVAGDIASLTVGAVNPAEGILLKGVINAGSHMLVDAIKHGVNHLPNFGGTTAALV